MSRIVKFNLLKTRIKYVLVAVAPAATFTLGYFYMIYSVAQDVPMIKEDAGTRSGSQIYDISSEKAKLAAKHALAAIDARHQMDIATFNEEASRYTRYMLKDVEEKFKTIIYSIESRVNDGKAAALKTEATMERASASANQLNGKLESVVANSTSTIKQIEEQVARVKESIAKCDEAILSVDNSVVSADESAIRLNAVVHLAEKNALSIDAKLMESQEAAERNAIVIADKLKSALANAEKAAQVIVDKQWNNCVIEEAVKNAKQAVLDATSARLNQRQAILQRCLVRDGQTEKELGQIEKMAKYVVGQKVAAANVAVRELNQAILNEFGKSGPEGKNRVVIEEATATTRKLQRHMAELMG